MRQAAIGLIASLFLASCVSVDAPRMALPTETISVQTAAGPHAFQVEIAADRETQARGLMYRREMAPDAGMLFDLHQSEQISFWMKNTYLPLDMVFIRADGTVSSVEPNAIPLSTASIPSQEPVRAVLEINGGRAHQLGIEPGDRVLSAIFNSQTAANTGGSRTAAR
ncbi:MAG: DUF192 domain-containing protein [Alphaproteobacteria bacterium]|nr:DUF192 domain-containing protein [Alphaproteobacteria bacterium]MBL6936543.1 DUF192 domain-containing protein [Alphaproteobacteria bacterium]MBL7098406.1 DUF192 domain-containing protein [Alphaproteobacteria bacterium]